VAVWCGTISAVLDQQLHPLQLVEVADPFVPADAAGVVTVVLLVAADAARLAAFHQRQSLMVASRVWNHLSTATERCPVSEAYSLLAVSWLTPSDETMFALPRVQ